MNTVDPQPMIEEWSDVERWLRAEANDCTRRPSLPASVAIAFHDGRVSAVVETPTFCAEDADLITDELCRFLPQLHPDQLLVVWPGAYGLDEHDDTALLWVLKAHIGDRDRGWRTLIYPLPFDDPDATAEPVEIDAVDPWSARIRGLFDAWVPPIHDSALVAPRDDRFVVFVHPHGPYASSTPLFGFN